MDPVKKKSQRSTPKVNGVNGQSHPHHVKRERIKISTSINVSAAFAFSNNHLGSHHVQQAFAFSKKKVIPIMCSFCALQHIMCNKLLRSPKKSSPSCAAFAFSNTLLLAGEKAVSCGVSVGKITQFPIFQIYERSMNK